MLKGNKLTEEHKRKIGDANKISLIGNVPWNKGKKCPQISETLKKKGIKPPSGYNKATYGFKGKHHSEESNQRNRDAHLGKNPQKGYHHAEETRKRISDAQIGRHAWNKGISPSEETREKISASMTGRRGEKARRWKGGSKLSNARRHNKRRESGFGFIPLNDCDVDTWVGHHLDKEHVLYIPKELHESVRHSVVDNIRMDIINEKAIDWYINYCGLQ